MALHLVTAATAEPISRDEAKAHLRVDVTSTELAPVRTLTYQAYVATQTGTGVSRSGYQATALVEIGTIAAGKSVTCKLQHSVDNVTYTDVSTTDVWDHTTSTTQISGAFTETESNGVYSQVYTGDRQYVRVSITAVVTGGTLGAQIVLDTLDTQENSLIDSLIKAARQICETRTRRAFVTQIWSYRFDQFPTCYPARIQLPKPPLIAPSSDLIVMYTDTNGSTQIFASTSYNASAPYQLPGYLEPIFGQTWPTARQQIDAVRVQFPCGYGSSTACPDWAKSAMKLLVGHLFEHREAVNIGNIATELPLAVQSLLDCGKWTY